MISIGKQQAQAIAQDFVDRQARRLSRSADRHQADNATRLQALRQALADHLVERSGEAARHLVVDLNQASAQWEVALANGLPYRETAAAAQLSAVATLGLWWRLDERLHPDVSDGAPLEWPRTPEQLRAWVQTGRAAPFGAASRQLRKVWPQARYALGRALVTGPTPPALRAIAEAVVPAAAGPRLQRFVEQERRLLAAGSRAGSPRSALADWCLAGDLVLGLGRCIRLLPSLAGPAVAGPVSLDSAALIDPLKEALRELVG